MDHKSARNLSPITVLTNKQSRLSPDVLKKTSELKRSFHRLDNILEEKETVLSKVLRNKKL